MRIPIVLVKIMRDASHSRSMAQHICIVMRWIFVGRRGIHIRQLRQLWMEDWREQWICG